MSERNGKDDLLSAGEPEPLRDLQLRDEILQVMYWMNGEGLGEVFALSDLQRFLSASTNDLSESLQALHERGMLSFMGDRFALTSLGKEEGGRRFADEFEDMLKPGHFECDEPDCECHDPEFADQACKHLSTSQFTM